MKRLLDVLLPPTCPGCGREGEQICPRCRKQMERRLDEPPGLPIGMPAHIPAGIVQLEWCCSFNGAARASVHALKYDGEQRLVPPLARLMAERWRCAAIGGEMLVPVPVHSERRKQRGFDQAELLAHGIGDVLHMPVRSALRRTGRTAAQHQLGRRARHSNVGGAFAVPADAQAAVRNKWIVLIDDVVTTGATLAGCARALYDAGAFAVSALSLARER
ncbi:MAG: ComF family protein [Candidatus Limnocylindrales bacterium]